MAENNFSHSLLSAEPMGLEVALLEVEVHASSGLPRVDIVGLAEPCVRESRQRVRAAIMASGWRFPEQKITINLAPASVKKTGTGLDLSMALGILLSAKKLKMPHPEHLKTHLFLGELSLSGILKPIEGILNIAIVAKEKGLRKIILPLENAREASLVPGLCLLPARNLKEVCKHLEEKDHLPNLFTSECFQGNQKSQKNPEMDLAMVKGQSIAKKALIIAAAGGHNLLFVGPPGSGKTLLLRSFPQLLLPLSEEQAMESTRIHSSAGLLNRREGMILFPPFRSPHHSISDAGFIGGGRYLHPGELSLAHNGVLFLDELPEFKRHVLETLREPLESGTVLLSRANGFVKYPARVQLLAAMNPCPCGYAGVSGCLCNCSSASIRNYTKRISGPLLDRIDLRLHLHPVPYPEFFKENLPVQKTDVSTEKACFLVERAYQKQKKRYEKTLFKKNAHIPAQEVERICSLSKPTQRALMAGLEQKKLSARGVHRILRVARTIEDLKEEEREISAESIYEALGFWHLPQFWN